jgi:hypothetical protein
MEHVKNRFGNNPPPSAETETSITAAIDTTVAITVPIATIAVDVMVAVAAATKLTSQQW